MSVPRIFLAWKKFHWSLTFDWFCAATARKYWARVISLDDMPARTVAMTVRRIGVDVITLSQIVLGFSGSADGVGWLMGHPRCGKAGKHRASGFYGSAAVNATRVEGVG